MAAAVNDSSRRERNGSEDREDLDPAGPIDEGDL
jgi:hypothetical protein